MDFKSRLKNIYFWIGVVGVVLAGAGVDFQSLTNWKLLLDAILSILANPVALVAAVMAFIGVFVDTSTPGLTDGKDVE